ncbi:hypothetical protein C2845_PM09G15080 [Panicum miliaceum]|uniref:Uncharacterized protein n=1 Tax=Panicum miliaceum TaxID=4540 RepID=A0A3L6RYN9_PANMI|nr:hypothetical protein C2845_PM09G15080 [Panicum miliaceum]
MEKQPATPTEGGQPNRATQVVADVLDKNIKNNHFLPNMAVMIAKCRSSLQTAQAQLEAERRTHSELQSTINNQHEAMDGLSKQMQEIEQARIKDQEEHWKKRAKLEARLELFASPKSTKLSNMVDQNLAVELDVPLKPLFLLSMVLDLFVVSGLKYWAVSAAGWKTYM